MRLDSLIKFFLPREERFRELLQTVRGLELFAGFCYTQFADTYQETNGLLRFDRTPKIPLETILEATTLSRTWLPGVV